MMKIYFIENIWDTAEQVLVKNKVYSLYVFSVNDFFEVLDFQMVCFCPTFYFLVMIRLY